MTLLRQSCADLHRQMTSGSLEEREKTYLTAAVSALRNPGNGLDVVPRIVLLLAFVTAVQTSPVLKKLESEGLDLDSIKQFLLQTAAPVVKSGMGQDSQKLSMMIALEALGILDRQAVGREFCDAVPSLLEASDALLDKGDQVGWDIRMLLASHFPEALGSPLKVNVAVEAPLPSKADGEPAGASPAATVAKTTLTRYVDTVLGVADETTKLQYLKELLEDLDRQETLSRLLVIYRLVHHLKGKKRPRPNRTFLKAD